jgi:hypothetical protein
MRKLAKSLYGSTKKSLTRSALSRNIEIEQLENRLTPATTFGAGGIGGATGLLIQGSNKADTLTMILA